MSRKQKSLRAFLHQNPEGCAESYLAGWDAHKGVAHAQTIQALKAERDILRDACQEIVKLTRYNCGNDEELLKHVASYNVAKQALGERDEHNRKIN